jgi:hypothetical protein
MLQGIAVQRSTWRWTRIGVMQQSEVNAYASKRQDQSQTSTGSQAVRSVTDTRTCRNSRTHSDSGREAAGPAAASGGR